MGIFGPDNRYMDLLPPVHFEPFEWVFWQTDWRFVALFPKQDHNGDKLLLKRGIIGECPLLGRGRVTYSKFILQS